jgi:hypothetical protein
MSEPNLSPLEKAIAKKVDQTKSKTVQPGYLRKLVAKMHLRIEAALARGCEYDDLAKAITESGVKISAATLKQYHTEHRRQLEQEAGTVSSIEDSILPSAQPAPTEKKLKIFADATDSRKASTQTNMKQAAIDKLSSKK